MAELPVVELVVRQARSDGTVVYRCPECFWSIIVRQEAPTGWNEAAGSPPPSPAHTHEVPHRPVWSGT